MKLEEKLNICSPIVEVGSQSLGGYLAYAVKKKEDLYRETLVTFENILSSHCLFIPSIVGSWNCNSMLGIIFVEGLKP